MNSLKEMSNPNAGFDCPWCNTGRKIIRTNRYTGHDFIGCTRFPSCRWSSPIDEDAERAFKMTKKTEIGKFVKLKNISGTIVGTIVGQNEYDNFILQVDKRSPVKGFKITDDLNFYLEDSIKIFKKNIKTHTYWHISPFEKLEEASESDLLPVEPKKVAASSKKDSLVKTTKKSKIKKEESLLDEEILDLENKVSAFVDEYHAAEQDEATSTSKVEEKEQQMTDKKSAIQTLKSDGEEAAFRVAGKRLSNGANNVVCNLLKSSLGPEHGAAVEAIMKTPAGNMLTQLALGWGITLAGNNVGGVVADPRIQKLATEFRVQGTAEGLDLVVGGLMQHLTPILNDALSLLPNNETAQTRIASSTESSSSEDEEELLSLGNVLVEEKRTAVK